MILGRTQRPDPSYFRFSVFRLKTVTPSGVTYPTKPFILFRIGLVVTLGRDYTDNVLLCNFFIAELENMLQHSKSTLFR